jgi:ubiquinone/menaquinone biosynthesis C-methylase UbiE
MNHDYVHGYDMRESDRLRDQAGTLVDLLHSDTAYPAGSRVLEAGCGVGTQTVTLARNSPEARIVSIDVSAASVAHARAKTEAAGIANVEFMQADIFDLQWVRLPGRDLNMVVYQAVCLLVSDRGAFSGHIPLTRSTLSAL